MMSKAALIAAVLFAFVLPLWIGLAEAALFAVLAVSLVDFVRRPTPRPVSLHICLPALIFVLIAVSVSLLGPRRAISLARFHKLLFPFFILALPMWFTPSAETNRPVSRLLLWLAAGIALRGLYDVFRVPYELSQGVALFDTGTMRDPQFYAAGLLLMAGLKSAGFFNGHGWRFIGLLLPIAAGLVLHFKRGAWFSFMVCILLWALLKKKFLAVGVILIIGILFIMLPQVRTRLEALPEEWTEMQGGRGALWFKIAPQLIPQHPWGVGWCAVEHEDLTGYAKALQPNLNHLHNNILQLALELGWLAPFVWIGWMLSVLWCAWRRYSALKKIKEPSADIVLGLFMALLSLLLIGVVEYNFGDTEIMMFYSLLIAVIHVYVVPQNGPADHAFLSRQR